MAEDKKKLQLLREILLTEDRHIADDLTQKLEVITKVLDEYKELAEKIDPLIDEKINDFVKTIPASLGPVITETIKEQVEYSQDEIVEALYPIVGRMIKRYISSELAKLAEDINNKVSKTFSTVGFKRKMKAFFSGTKEGDLVLSELDQATVSEVFAIQKGSGILLGNFSLTETIDKDMLSGMLTAIKSFVEDAFQGGDQRLESIQYELYSIHIQNFHSYYIAVVISGNYSKSYVSKLEDKLFKVSRKLSTGIHNLSRIEVDKILESLFKEWKNQ